MIPREMVAQSMRMTKRGAYPSYLEKISTSVSSYRNCIPHVTSRVAEAARSRCLIPASAAPGTERQCVVGGDPKTYIFPAFVPDIYVRHKSEHGNVVSPATRTPLWTSWAIPANSPSNPRCFNRPSFHASLSLKDMEISSVNSLSGPLRKSMAHQAIWWAERRCACCQLFGAEDIEYQIAILSSAKRPAIVPLFYSIVILGFPRLGASGDCGNAPMSRKYAICKPWVNKTVHKPRNTGT